MKIRILPAHIGSFCEINEHTKLVEGRRKSVAQLYQQPVWEALQKLPPNLHKKMAQTRKQRRHPNGSVAQVER